MNLRTLSQTLAIPGALLSLAHCGSDPSAQSTDAESGISASSHPVDSTATQAASDGGATSQGLTLPAVDASVSGAGAGQAIGDAAPPNACGAPACNGTADDTSVLQCLLDAGGAVVLPAGTCMVKRTLIMGASGTSLRGNGAAFVMVYAAAPTGSTVAPASTKATVLESSVPNPGFPILSLAAPGCEVSGLTVNGAATADGLLENAAIYVAPSAQTAALHDLEVTAAVSAGIYVQGSGSQVLRDYVHGNYGIGIFVDGNAGATPSRTDGVIVSRNLVAKSHLAWYAAEDDDPGDGLDIDTMTSNAVVEDNTVQDNDIIIAHESNADCDTAPAVGGGSVSRCYSWGHHVTGNVVTGVLDNGISVKKYEEEFVVAANTIASFGENRFKPNGYGVKVSGAVGASLLGGNVISGNTITGFPSSMVCLPISAANYPTGGESKVTCGGILLWQDPTGTPAGISITKNAFPKGTAGQDSIDVLGGAERIAVTDNTGTVDGGVSTIDTAGLPMTEMGCGPGGGQPCPTVPGGDDTVVRGNN